MSDTVDLAVDCLATWRLAHLAVADVFPPLVAARTAIVKRYGPESPQAYLTSCISCTGVWAAAVITGRRRSLRRLLAAAAAAPLLEAALNRLEGR